MFILSFVIILISFPLECITYIITNVLQQSSISYYERNLTAFCQFVMFNPNLHLSHISPPTFVTRLLSWCIRKFPPILSSRIRRLYVLEGGGRLNFCDFKFFHCFTLSRSFFSTSSYPAVTQLLMWLSPIEKKKVTIMAVRYERSLHITKTLFKKKKINNVRAYRSLYSLNTHWVNNY